MFNYRENAYIPPPPPSVMERIRTWVQNLRGFWWKSNHLVVKGFVILCVLVVLFLALSKQRQEAYNNVMNSSNSVDSFHDSQLHRSMFHSRRSRSSRH